MNGFYPPDYRTPEAPEAPKTPHVICLPHEIARLARTLMNEHGLSHWTFEWDRAKRRAGCCKHSQRKITLSFHYVEHNGDKPYDLRDTILHEIAHALAGPGKGHGLQWKTICRRIGARPVRCYDSNRIKMPPGRWAAVCPSCHKYYRRHRRPRRGVCFCPRCGAEEGQLRFTCL